MGSIEALGLSDLPSLHELSQAIGWRHTEDDWRTILTTGRVFSHRRDDGGCASSGAVFEYGPSLAAIGMILVAPPYRGRGLARAMMRQCLAMAGSRPATLIATAQGEPLYRALGFVEVERVCRVVTANPVRGSRLAPITARDVAAVMALDADAYGADRRGLLSALIARAETTAVLHDAGGGLRGFGVVVRQGGRLTLGPVIARDEDAALAIFGSLAADADGDVRVELPTGRPSVLDAFAALGAKPSDDAPVMVLGAASMPGRREAIYALASRGFG